MKKFLSILTVLFLVVLAANAQNQKWRIAIAGAYAPTTGGNLYTINGESSAPAAIGFGVNAGYFLNENIAVGIDITSYASAYTITGASNGYLGTTAYMAKFEYLFGESKVRPYGTVLAGFATQATSGGFNSLTGSGFAFAPGLGARLALGERWDIDLNVRYLYQSTSIDYGTKPNNGWSLPVALGVGFKF